VTIIFVGGHDTTRFQLGHLIATFLREPELWSQASVANAMASNIVEEVLRYRPAIMENFRYAREDIEYRETLIPRGTYISISSAAANRDNQCAASGADFRLDRQPSQHVTFGHGPHFCLGAALARTELEESLHALTGRMRTIRPAGPVEYSLPRAVSGPECVPMAFDSHR
jgi:cytochrome P450